MPEWADWLDALADRNKKAESGGGVERINRQHSAGRLTARERIAKCLDTGSFTEIGALAAGAPVSGERIPADGLIGGFGTIAGTPVVIMAEDFTVKGGSIGHVGAAKRVRLAELALQECNPFIMLLEGAGERADNALERYPRTPNDLQFLARMKGQIPVVAVVMGTSAGHGALGAVFADFVLMTEQAALFAAGPYLVKAALGQTVTPVELGGAEVHAKSGVAHNIVATETDAFECVKTYIQYVKVPLIGSDDQPARFDEILDIIPANIMHPYDMRRVLEGILDEGRYLHLQKDYGASLITALGRLNGRTVLVLASQPITQGGAITHEAARKAAHWLDVAYAFSLPTLFLCDTPGVMPGPAAEQFGTLKAAGKFYRAQARLKTPKLHVTLRKAFGFGSSLMAMNPFDRQTVTLAFPNASLGAMPAFAGAKSAKMSDEDANALALQVEGAWRGADNVAFDRVIDPRDIREELIAALNMSSAGKS